MYYGLIAIVLAVCFLIPISKEEIEEEYERKEKRERKYRRRNKK